jgi:diguanylate cyclase (GGDEF)-like protein
VQIGIWFALTDAPRYDQPGPCAEERMNHGPTVTDPMTGALTRAVFHDHVREALAVASANGEELSLLVLDLDHFKSINDAFGHARGDQVLVEFACRASDVSRGSDALFRFGGDEFVLLLPGTGSEQAVLLAERLIVAVRSAPFAGDPPLTISVSVGLATANGADDSAEELLARADRHLYAAKRAGRGRVAGNDEAKADNDGRLLEREGANQSVRQFLKLLPQYRRGALLASGIDGAGHTSFLREAQQNARLLGYRTVALTGRSAYATHPYGALLDGLGLEMGLLAVAGDTEALLAGLNGTDAGVVWLIDRMDLIDPASLNTLRRLLETGDGPALGVVVAGTETHRAEAWLGGLLRERVELAPLSLVASQVLVRTHLRWEPPDELTAQVWQQTGGLPGRIVTALEGLQKDGGLIRGADGYALMPDFASRLGALTASHDPERSLPRPGKSLVGRDRELVSLKTLLLERRLVSIVGQGGLGKTHLAMQLALEVSHRFRDGAVFVSLASLTEASELGSRLAQEFGLKPSRDALEALETFLARREMLLVLDNFEHLLEAAPAVGRLLAVAPGLSVLTTSRERLRLPEEWMLALDGLDLPVEGRDPDHSGALRLLLQAARRVDAGVGFEREDALAAARICRLVGGMPLGLELAASWVKVLSFPEIADEIEGNLGFLRLPDASGEHPERHRSLQAAFESSWHFLDAHQQHVLARLSLFRGGFTREAALTVAGASVSGLLALINLSLLQRDPQRQGRYVMHELLRQFALVKLQEGDQEYCEARREHAAYFLGFAEMADPELRGPDQEVWLERVNAELDNLRTALRVYQDGDAPGDGLRLSIALKWFFYTRGLIFEGISWLEFFLERGGGATDAVRARALAELGGLEKEVGQAMRSRQRIEESLRLYRGLNDAEGLGDALRVLGLLECEAGNYRESLAHLEESLALHRQAEAWWGVGATLNDLGIVCYFLDDRARSEVMFRESLEVKRRIGDAQGVAYAIGNLAGFSQNPDDELAAEEESLAIKRRLNDRQGIANSLANIGIRHARDGNYALADARLAESLALLLEIGREYKVADVLTSCAEQALERRDFAKALSLAASVTRWQQSAQTRLPPGAIKLLERVTEAARAALGSQAAMVWNDGWMLDLESMVMRTISGAKPGFG